MTKIGVVSLGCDKNTVDTEKMLYLIKMDGYEITAEPEDADVIIVNTCAFIEKARKEAVDTILEYAAYKEKNLKKLIVTGCLPEKYIDEIFESFSEVDGFLGVNDYGKIGLVIKETLAGKRVNFVKGTKEKEEKSRLQSTPRHYAYLKIADGCLNRCAFCTIPSIRGAYRSRPINDLISEAEELATNGVRELILVAQDTTAYGIDLYGGYKITELLQKLSEIDGIVWIRLLYCYPEKISDTLIEEIAINEKICKYLDIPFQHVNDGILKRMGRKYNKSGIIALLEKLREKVPAISIRSTFMVGFPGETEEQFEELRRFLYEYQIDNAGFFEYSKESGTAAAEMDGQVKAAIKKQRYRKITNDNQIIIFGRQRKKQDKIIPVMVNYYDKERCFYVGRDGGSAPDIDTEVFIDSTEELCPGEIVNVKITRSENYDLDGILVKEAK